MALKRQIVLVCTALFFAVVVSTPVHASLSYKNAEAALGTVADKTGVQKTDLPTASGQLIKSALGVLGLIFFVLVIYAGITWMTARGDEEAANKARETIFAAVIGLSVILASYAITNFVTSRILEGNKDTSSGGMAGGANSVGGTLGDEKVGCCIDWSPGAQYFDDGVPAYRITTESDCKSQGEAKESDGTYCTGPKVNCWIFDGGLADINSCKDITF